MQTWTQEELDAYEYAFMREEDERARLDKAKQDGKEESQEEAVLGFFENGVSIELIAKSMKISEDRIRQIIENQTNK